MLHTSQSNLNKNIQNILQHCSVNLLSFALFINQNNHRISCLTIYVCINQITEASPSNFIEGRKRPPSNEVAIQIVKKTRQPPNHYFMIGPPPHKLPKYQFIMLLSYRRQY
uniref:Uncharacterized protein MANES_01G073200 n=1 Tax=Rhizophora mucronata TaxID=61149 RepID=A0A2P2KIJ8_RHIMU